VTITPFVGLLTLTVANAGADAASVRTMQGTTFITRLGSFRVRIATYESSPREILKCAARHCRDWFRGSEAARKE